MTGMARETGKTLADESHIVQSVNDILTTPLGSRVMRRDYGSRLFELIDAPLNALTRLLIIAATAGAIRRWEPRIMLDRVALSDPSANGSVSLNLTGHRTDTPSPLTFQLHIAL